MKRIKYLDRLLTSENINSSIIDLDEFICNLCKYGDKIERLSEPQKLFYFNQALEKEVNNGGFDQYFCNSGSENAYETLLALKSIGANKTAAILQKAIDLVLKLVEEAKEVPDDAFDKLDKEFLSYQENLNVLNIEFVKKNKDFF